MHRGHYRPRSSRRAPPAFAAMPPRCTVGIVGATSGVGHHVVRRLSQESVPVRAIVRSAARAQQTLPANIAVYEIASTADPDTRRLREALRGIHSLFICTGTTAFPTRAWADGNTPSVVDVTGMSSILACLDKRTIRQVLLLSSIGTTRPDRLPFAIVNLFGVLSAKRQGELLLASAAARYGFRYSIVRPGRLIGGPHTNVGMNRLDATDSMQDVELHAGDAGKGNCTREAAADALIMAWRSEGDFDFSVLEKFGSKPTRFGWQEKLRKTQAVRMDVA